MYELIQSAIIQDNTEGISWLWCNNRNEYNQFNLYSNHECHISRQKKFEHQLSYAFDIVFNPDAAIVSIFACIASVYICDDHDNLIKLMEMVYYIMSIVMVNINGVLVVIFDKGAVPYGHDISTL